MPPRRRAADAPVPIDVGALRSALAAGKTIRVGISRSAQFPDGATGRVRKIGDPATDGDEFIQVEVSLNGTKDVLPFTPSDLTPANRRRVAPAGSAHGSPESSTTAPRSQRLPARTVTVPPSPAAPPELFPSGPETTSNHIAARPATGRPQPGAEPVTALPTAVRPPDVTSEPSVPPPDVRGKRTRHAQAVAICITTAEGVPPQWRVEARVGARVAVRSTPVSPARVWELIDQLDNELLRSTVGAILSEHRRITQDRADALIAELKAVRAELDSLPPQQ